MLPVRQLRRSLRVVLPCTVVVLLLALLYVGRGVHWQRTPSEGGERREKDETVPIEPRPANPAPNLFKNWVKRPPGVTPKTITPFPAPLHIWKPKPAKGYEYPPHRKLYAARTFDIRFNPVYPPIYDDYPIDFNDVFTFEKDSEELDVLRVLQAQQNYRKTVRRLRRRLRISEIERKDKPR